MATTYRTETRTDAQGQPYDVRIPEQTGIAVDDIMNPQQAVQIPELETTDYNSMLNAFNVSPAQQQGQQDQIPSYLKAYLENQPEVPNPATALSNLQTQYDTQAKQKKVSDLSAQLNAITTAGQVAQQQLEAAAAGKDITTSFLGKQQQEAARQSLIQAAPVKMQLDIAQGDLEAAQTTVNQLFQAQTQYETNLFNWKQGILDKVYEYGTKKEQQQLDAIKAKQDRAYTEKINNINYLRNLSSTAALNGQGDLMTQISAISPDSPTFEQDTNDVLSQINIAPDNQIVKLDNGNTVIVDKNTGKIISNLGGMKETSGGLQDSIFGALVNTTASLETTVAGKEAIANQLASYINNEDYASAYNQIANTVENSLPGETKTRFANARIDVEVLTGFKDALEKYKDAGGDMGLLSGTVEEIERKLGQVKDPKLTEIAVQMQREFQTYRNAMTGAAFTPQESREYASVNPTSNKSLDLNLAVIQGALNQLDNRVNGTIRAKVPQVNDLIKVIEIPKTAEEAKSKVNDVWQANPQLHDTIMSLFNTGEYDDFAVLEYLKTKNLIQ